MFKVNYIINDFIVNGRLQIVLSGRRGGVSFSQEFPQYSYFDEIQNASFLSVSMLSYSSN